MDFKVSFIAERKQQGFTLIQLMAVVAIVGIMFQVGSALFADVVHRKVVRSTALQLEKRIGFIVQQSKGRGEAMAICAGQSTNCNTNDWSLGYVTVTTNPVSDTPGKVEVVHRVEALDPVVNILSNRQKLVFLPGGFLESNTDEAFYVCPIHRAQFSYKITVSASGLVDFEELEGEMKCDQISV